MACAANSAAYRPDRPRVASRFGADRRRRRRRRGRARELGVQRLGEVRQLRSATRSVGEARSSASPGSRASSPGGPTTASASCSRAARIDTDGEGTLLVTEEWLLIDDSGAESRPDARRLRTRLSRVRSASGKRSGSAKAASATIRMATSTTSRASRARRHRARVRGGSGRRREPRRRSTISSDSSWPAAMTALCASSSFPTRAP